MFSKRGCHFPAAVIVLLLAIVATRMDCAASDHADPIDPFNRERLEGGITDLFVFPVRADDQPAHPYSGNQGIPLHYDPADLAREPLSIEDQRDIDSIVIIMCVRRSLTPQDEVNLAPYIYRVHIDWNSTVTFAQKDTDEELARARGQGAPGYAAESTHTHGDDPPSGLAARPPRPTPHEAFLRYGGYVERPAEIDEELIIEFRLDNSGMPAPGHPVFIDQQTKQPAPGWMENVQVHSGLHDDPFIFPAFFKANVAAMAVRIPITLLPSPNVDLLVWGTSHLGDRQVDHVGRSLRTQNPRFELLNVRHPRDHAKLVMDEHADPSLMRDLANRFNLGSLFAYRAWDFVPDVLIYTTKYPVGFPNGRLLTDDVAALLAQHGDTLLYELSFQHHNGSWPRERVNDAGGGAFAEKFPYLLPAQSDARPPAPLRLSAKTRGIVIALAVGLIFVLILENWFVARLYYRFRTRRRYL